MEQMTMVTISMGNKKKSYKSIKEAWQAEAPHMGYMTFYMRLRHGNKAKAASKQPVRQYRKAA